MKFDLNEHNTNAACGDRRRRRIALGVLSVVLVAVIIFIPVYFATRPDRIEVIETEAEETLPSLIKVAPIGVGAILIEYTELLEDNSTVFYYLTAQDLNFTTMEGVADPDYLVLYLTGSAEPTIQDISINDMAVRLRRRDLSVKENALRIGLINSVAFPFKLPDTFLPGDFNGAILVEENPEETFSFVELSTSSFNVIVDPERNIGSPTSQPTQSPTMPPTTATPTTKSPTLVPSRNPTKSPTPVPSRSPTDFPTSGPSRGPTQSPSLSPTTPSPSKLPTPGPSLDPTSEPTAISSSAKPTRALSQNPTPTPTVSPRPTLKGFTRSPTNTPSFVPTNRPTTTPTRNHTGLPSQTPTSLPTTMPTHVPSNKPSLPTNRPTIISTRNPTGRPSQFPTKLPTMKTTSPPTDVPSTNPTKLPTAEPTVSPTKALVPASSLLPPILRSDLSGSYNIDGTITIDYVQGFQNGEVVDLPRLQFDIPNLSDAPGPYLYLSKRSYSETRGGDLKDEDVYIPIDTGNEGGFNVKGRFDQFLDEIENVQDLEDYANGSWIVWCRPFQVWIGGGAISTS